MITGDHLIVVEIGEHGGDLYSDGGHHLLC